MASEILIPVGVGSMSLTAELYTLTSDTAVESAMTLTEKTNAKGWYAASNTGTETGLHRLQIKNGSATVGYYWVYLTNASPTEDIADDTVAVRPTTLGRTLDVTATGAAGIDWANVENPATSLNLSATSIDVDQMVASVSGAVGSVTGAVGSVTGAVGSVTGAVGSVTGAVGSVTGNVGGNVTGSVGSVVGNVGGNVVGSVASVTAITTSSGSVSTYDFTAAARALLQTEAEDALAAVGVTTTVTGRIDAAISSRMASYTQPAGFLAATFPTDPADQSLIIAATDALLTAINALNNLSSAQAQTAAAAALTAYDPPTNAEMEARTLVAASYATAAALTVVDDLLDTEVAAIITHLGDIKGATFSGATDSLEAIRDRGDVAWITGSGAGSLDAAGVRAAVGLASANLDTQLGTIDDLIDTEIATLITLAEQIIARLGALVEGSMSAITTGRNIPDGGTIFLHSGDDYHASDTTSITWPVVPVSASLSGATVTMLFYSTLDRTSGVFLTVTGAATLVSAGIYSLAFPLTAAQSATLVKTTSHLLEARATFSSGRISTLAYAAGVVL